MRPGLCFAVGTATVMVLSGCALGMGSNGSDYCAPQLTVAPTSVAAGALITITSEDVCEVSVPVDGWQIGVDHVEPGGSSVVIKTTETFDGSFEVSLILPVDFPAGEGIVGVDNWDFSGCPSNADCPNPYGSFEVTG